MTLASMRKYGVVGSASFLAGTVIYVASSSLRLGSQTYYVYLVLAGLGFLALIWTIGEASKYFRRRLIIDTVIAVAGADAIIRMGYDIYEPQRMIGFRGPDWGLFYRPPPADAIGVQLYLISLAGSIVVGWLYLVAFTNLARASGVPYFRVAGWMMLLGAFASVFLGSMITDLAILPLGFGFFVANAWIQSPPEDTGVIAKGARGPWSQLWFTEGGVAEVRTIYRDVFLLTLYLGIAFSFGTIIILQGAGYAQYSGLSNSPNKLGEDTATFASVLVALVVSRWKLPEFSDKALFNQSRRMISWEDVRSVKLSRRRRLSIETAKGLLSAGLFPQDQQAFAKLVTSKIGDRAELGKLS